MSAHGTNGPHTTRILERPGQQAVLAVARARLVVCQGTTNPAHFELDQPATTIGSDSANDIVLSDPSVSARHCEIELGEEGLRLRDLHSTNGTYVNGVRVRDAFLENRCIVALGATELRLEVADAVVEIPLSNRDEFGALLGHSPVMRAAFAVLERAAASDSTVLITGESGTGKELAARAVHDRSARRKGPFVVVDCGAIPATLIESHLFGHTRGAFTGASETRDGLCLAADGGTLVLDEVGELPLDLQPKLLRMIESRTVQRVGETDRRAIDVRIIACTHRNLEQEVAQGRFRHDLFFRLSVIAVRLPALRERSVEIERLAGHFASLLGAEPSQVFTPEILRVLASHTWPGNVRELRNVVERLVVLPGHTPAAYLSTLGAATSSLGGAAPQATDLSLPFHEAKQKWVDAFEREYLARQLAACDHNISQVARAAGLSRHSCYRLIQKHGLEH